MEKKFIFLITRQATRDDYEAILAITREETLYDGTDYLPFALKPWLEGGRRVYILVVRLAWPGLADEEFAYFYYLDKKKTYCYSVNKCVHAYYCFGEEMG